MTIELDQSAITAVLKERGEWADEGQPEQVAGRWIENGFESPAEVAAWLDAGVNDPEEARHRVQAGETAKPPASHGRDAVRGTSEHRSNPGDPSEDMQSPESAP